MILEHPVWAEKIDLIIKGIKAFLLYNGASSMTGAEGIFSGCF
jgi:hypothetical protein